MTSTSLDTVHPIYEQVPCPELFVCIATPRVFKLIFVIEIEYKVRLREKQVVPTKSK